MPNAKVGDVISEKARKAYAKALGGRVPLAAIETHVTTKTEGQGGQWFCIDCGAFPENQFMAGSHERDKPKHRLAWRSASSGNVEEP